MQRSLWIPNNKIEVIRHTEEYMELGKRMPSFIEFHKWHFETDPPFPISIETAFKKDLPWRGKEILIKRFLSWYKVVYTDIEE